ncbi:hypothetical protein BU23DRAFT_234680 [Bimuria novae-zelandiae CBS 107.79]|uniref:Uncharacterized protein n=1 Tax=Bimuria novae-zelandiae CBS 107.79 TaxID=1447943 RepID=A0A6A5V0R0_9PLEO|nr:hypothetical protein BU23DRAFT_234680 [Bimuria novae-zelandiae CBS 107.79]
MFLRPSTQVRGLAKAHAAICVRQKHTTDFWPIYMRLADLWHTNVSLAEVAPCTMTDRQRIDVSATQARVGMGRTIRNTVFFVPYDTDTRIVGLDPYAKAGKCC